MIKPLSLRCLMFVGVVVSSVSLPIWAGQQAVSSLTDLDFEKGGGNQSPQDLFAENRELRDALSNVEQTLGEMRRTLAVTAGEAESFKRQALEIKKRFEALGSGVSGEAKKLEQRLLAAVTELQQLEAGNKRLAGAIISLTEAVTRFSGSASSNDVDARLALEAAVRAATDAIGGSGSDIEGKAVASTLNDGLVISVRDELLLVVANLGRGHGVKVGMPFHVVRGNTLVGTVRVVDVREKFAGAVVQNLSSEKDRIRIGDRLKVEAQQ